MSEFSEGSNPYEPSQQGPPPAAKPAGLTAICIINIVLGAAGLLAVCSGGVGLAAGPAVQQWVEQAQVEGEGEGGPGEANLRMQSEINELNARYRPYSIVVLLAHLIVAALLLWGGIQALRLREGGAKILMIACGVAILFELLRGIGNTILQLQMMGVMEQHLPDMAAGGMTADFTRVLMYVGFGCGFVWLFGKVIFYGASIAYLRKPHIQALFKTAH